jgi:hypothetical protein
MLKPYFSPWIGKRYDSNRILVLSESTYDWTGEDGEIYTPQPSHAQDSIPWHIKHFGQNRYFTALTRVLCGEKQPSVKRMEQVWNDYAYTVFVQGSVGYGPGTRPTPNQWTEAGAHFLLLLERIRPQKVIVTGLDMWAEMPECATGLLDDLQAYRLSNGDFVWCLALPHPANRRQGFSWDEISEKVRLFRASIFPAR